MGLATADMITFNDLYVNDAETMGGLLGNDDTICAEDSTCVFSPNPDNAISD